MLIKIEPYKEQWQIRTVDAHGATWTRRMYKTARGVVQAVGRLQDKGHVIGSERDRRVLNAAREAMKG
jgi:hypothetical protein